MVKFPLAVLALINTFSVGDQTNTSEPITKSQYSSSALVSGVLEASFYNTKKKHTSDDVLDFLPKGKDTASVLG